MIRVQAQLTEEQADRIKARATEEGVSVAELLRRGADLVLEQVPLATREQRKQRALAAVGHLADETRDVSRVHDDYLDDGSSQRSSSTRRRSTRCSVAPTSSTRGHVLPLRVSSQPTRRW